MTHHHTEPTFDDEISPCSATILATACTIISGYHVFALVLKIASCLDAHSLRLTSSHRPSHMNRPIPYGWSQYLLSSVDTGILSNSSPPGAAGLLRTIAFSATVAATPRGAMSNAWSSAATAMPFCGQADRLHEYLYECAQTQSFVVPCNSTGPGNRQPICFCTRTRPVFHGGLDPRGAQNRPLSSRL
jgi:hypothetical protein